MIWAEKKKSQMPNQESMLAWLSQLGTSACSYLNEALQSLIQNLCHAWIWGLIEFSVVYLEYKMAFLLKVSQKWVFIHSSFGTDGFSRRKYSTFLFGWHKKIFQNSKAKQATQQKHFV